MPGCSGFYDYGWGKNVHLLPDEPSSLTLGGIGLGIDYRLKRNLSLRGAYGWQVNQDGFDEGRPRSLACPGHGSLVSCVEVLNFLLNYSFQIDFTIQTLHSLSS